MKKLWLRFLARFRFSNRAICEMSKDLGNIDYHDYPDDIFGCPLSFYVMTCKRCGKRFTI